MKDYLLKFLMVFIGISFCKPSSAQLYLHYSQPYTVLHDEEINALSAKQYQFNHKEINVKETKKSWRNIYNYDAEGRLISFLTEKQGKHGTKQKSRGFSIMYAYPDKTLKQKIFYFKNQVAFRTDSFDFNRFGKITAYTVFDKHKEPEKQDQYAYDSTFLKSHHFSIYTKKGVKKIRQKQIYDYDAGHQLSKITYYNKKGEAYLNTVFDCNPIGINHKVRKDSAYRCEKFDTDSLGNKITIMIETIKNRSIKVVRYYNQNDKLIAYKYFNLKKDLPVYYAFFNAKTGMTTKYIHFKKGKETFRSESTLNDQNNLVERTEFYKNKISSVLRNEYNTDGLLVVSKGYNAKNKLTKTMTYTYALKNL